ncbi:MAG: carboxypeptidase-like regulatory domain-containing protein [Bacteroidales bacterium]|jgi:hypothetical protein|nr:carboxypeptidase-like regulatory domain-containing protein [Bacteroidales bacterium]
MYRNLVITIIILFIFITACKKDNNTITGNISDLTTGEAISNATVDLYFSEISSSGNYNPTFKHFGTTTTDASGNYRFEFDSKLFIELRLKFTKEGYHTTNIEFDPEGTSSFSYVKNMKLPIEAYLKVQLIKSSGNTTDNVMLRISGINPECLVCCDEEQRNYYGNKINETFICPVVGGDSLHFEVLSGSTQILKSLYCPPVDTTFFQILL